MELLHELLPHAGSTEWFETEVRLRIKGKCTLGCFADDAVMAFENFLDAKRVLGVLGKVFDNPRHSAA
jgi:hypothetical protein